MALLKLLLIAATAHALDWSDLENDHKYLLNEDVQITEQLKLNKGDALLLEDIVGGEVPVLYFVFHNHMCTDSALTTEMVIHKGVGVELEENCTVGIFVEGSDYYSESFVSDAANESGRFRPQSSVH